MFFASAKNMSEKNLAKRTAQGYVSGAFIVSVSDNPLPD